MSEVQTLARFTRWLSVSALLCVAVSLVHCKSTPDACALRCGNVCLPASACTSGLRCPASAPCDPCSGQCRMTCSASPDCGGAGVMCCESAGSKVCIDPTSDRYHCGACEKTCDAIADRCVAGQCVCGTVTGACGDGSLCCGGACVPKTGANCQACGVPCDGTDLASGMGTQLATALAVDTPLGTGAGMGSNLDGVFDPGEVVYVAPSWKNLGTAAVTLSGTASKLSCPNGVPCSLAGAMASYGTVQAGATASCTATNQCYVVKGLGAQARPSGHLDGSIVETLSTGATQTYTLHIGQTFGDVLPMSAYYPMVETLAHLGIATECNNAGFCPDQGLTRAEAAVYIARAIAGADTNVPVSGMAGALGQFNCLPGGVSVFSDVPPTDPACKYVHYLVAHGITAGCASGGVYCPSVAITRGQLAVFIATGLLGVSKTVPSSYVDPASGNAYDCSAQTPIIHFTDVMASDPQCPSAHYLWATGVAGGCSATTFCPTVTATRAQAAVFVVQGWKLLLYAP